MSSVKLILTNKLKGAAVHLLGIHRFIAILRNVSGVRSSRFFIELVSITPMILYGFGFAPIGISVCGIDKHYITCHLLYAFTQSDLNTLNTVEKSHRSNLGGKCLDTAKC